MINHSTLTTIPGEIQKLIYSFCGIQEIGRLSQVSKQTLNLDIDFIWQKFCQEAAPNLVNQGDMTWKELYFKEIDINKFRGDDILFVTYSIGYDDPELALVFISKELDTMRVHHLKKIIQKDQKLNCHLERINILSIDSSLDRTTSLNDFDNVNDLIENNQIHSFRANRTKSKSNRKNPLSTCVIS